MTWKEDKNIPVLGYIYEWFSSNVLFFHFVLVKMGMKAKRPKRTPQKNTNFPCKLQWWSMLSLMTCDFFLHTVVQVLNQAADWHDILVKYLDPRLR